MGTAIALEASAVPGNNMGSIDVPRDGTLVGVDWSLIAAISGADFSNIYQVSFGTTIQLVNDSRSVISNCAMGMDFTTSGAGVIHANKYVSLPDIAVGAGERIYLHGSGTAVSVTIVAMLFFDFELDRALARRR